VTSIAPIPGMRVAAIQPAAPGPDADPYEDGLDVDVVLEPMPVRLPDPAQVAAAKRRSDTQADTGQRPPSAWSPAAASTVASILPTAPPTPGGPMRGNAAVSTGFDRSPAAFVDAPRAQQQSMSPVARAYAAFAGR
jgi:hypothetical protein